MTCDVGSTSKLLWHAHNSAGSPRCMLLVVCCTAANTICKCMVEAKPLQTRSVCTHPGLVGLPVLLMRVRDSLRGLMYAELQTPIFACCAAGCSSNDGHRAGEARLLQLLPAVTPSKSTCTASVCCSFCCTAMQQACRCHPLMVWQQLPVA